MTPTRGPLGWKISSFTYPNRADRRWGHKGRSILEEVLTMLPTDPAVGVLGCNCRESAMAEQGQTRVALTIPSFPLQTCHMPWISHSVPSSVIYSSSYFQRVELSPMATCPWTPKASACVLFRGSLYILPALETIHNWLPNPAPLGSSIPQLRGNNLQGNSPEVGLLCIRS